EQAGPPAVSVSAQCVGSTTRVKLSQQRYFYDRGRFEAGSGERWRVPVCMKSSSGARQCGVLTEAQSEITLPGCSSWVLANAGATGFYRSAYDAESVRALAADAETSLTPAERIRLLSDVWASVRVGRLQIGDFLALAKGLQSDRQRAVVYQLTGHLEFI